MRSGLPCVDVWINIVTNETEKEKKLTYLHEVQIVGDQKSPKIVAWYAWEFRWAATPWDTNGGSTVVALELLAWGHRRATWEFCWERPTGSLITVRVDQNSSTGICIIGRPAMNAGSCLMLVPREFCESLGWGDHSHVLGDRVVACEYFGPLVGK